MNLLEEAQYEYLKYELKKVLIDFQAIAQYYHDKGDTQKAQNAENNLKRVANYAGFMETAITALQQNRMEYYPEATIVEAITYPKENRYYDKEAYRRQTLIDVERDMPHLFDRWNPSQKHVSQ